MNELLHPDHNDPVDHIVVLDPLLPSAYLRFMLDSDVYKGKLTFIMGSPLIAKVPRSASLAGTSRVMGFDSLQLRD